MRNIYIFTFTSLLLASITSTAFVDYRVNKNLYNIFNLNENFKDLNLSYNSTYDSDTVNRLYSQKKIVIEKNNNNKHINKFIVSIKKKPLNPSLVESLKIKINSKKSNFYDLQLNLDFLSGTKKEFVKTLLPLISFENQKILLERKSLKAMKKFLNNNNTLSKKYRIQTDSRHKLDIIKELLDIVDIIPNSIVLAQAANESGWGSSRFAREYNALFGEYTYDFSNGVVPLLREEGEKHLVKAFDSFDRSVESYFNNLNSHYAYREFREVRKIMRENNNFSNINLLINELDTYAVDKNYIQTINSIIRVNKLNQLDNFNYIEIKS